MLLSCAPVRQDPPSTSIGHGWVCQKCSEWVPVPPRKCDAAREPEDWWWCLKCKQNKKAKSQKEKKMEAVAATCKSVVDMFKSKPK